MQPLSPKQMVRIVPLLLMVIRMSHLPFRLNPPPVLAWLPQVLGRLTTLPLMPLPEIRTASVGGIAFRSLECCT